MKTNEEVLQLVQEKSLMKLLRRRKENWIGHILRGENLLREMTEGRMIGKRPRGRKRVGMLNGFLHERSVVCGMKEKGGKQERMEKLEAKNVQPNDRTLMMLQRSKVIHGTA